jgi:hypothetical protein
VRNSWESDGVEEKRVKSAVKNSMSPDERLIEEELKSLDKV